MISELELNTVTRETVAVISLKGQIDYNNCHELREAIDAQLDAGLSMVVVDAKLLNFIDSSCLGMLVAAQRKVSEHGGRLAMVVNQQIDRVLTVSGLTSLFEVAEGVEEAVASMSA